MCNHKDENGRSTYEVEDNRCDTDRGTMGSRIAFCTRCNEDITEIAEAHDYDDYVYEMHLEEERMKNHDENCEVKHD